MIFDSTPPIALDMAWLRNEFPGLTVTEVQLAVRHMRSLPQGKKDVEFGPNYLQDLEKRVAELEAAEFNWVEKMNAGDLERMDGWLKEHVRFHHDDIAPRLADLEERITQNNMELARQEARVEMYTSDWNGQLSAARKRLADLEKRFEAHHTDDVASHRLTEQTIELYRVDLEKKYAWLRDNLDALREGLAGKKLDHPMFKCGTCGEWWSKAHFCQETTAYYELVDPIA